MTDIKFMEAAVIVAENNIDFITNQSVGAIIVKNNKIVGCGCRLILKNMPSDTGVKLHKCFHAENLALLEAGIVNSSGATIYVTKEPCTTRWHNSVSHHFPPCCELIRKYGVKRVVIGSYDDDFGAGGKKWLEDNGIKVDLLLDFKERIDKISNRKVAPIVKNEYEEFKRLMNEPIISRSN
jgi:pyrimidine deaminase RibD-like protein